MRHFPGTFESVSVVLAVLRSPDGERPQAQVLAWLRCETGKVKQLGTPKLRSMRCPPYPTGPQALVVTIDAVAVAALHLAQGWRLPDRIVDLMVEHRNLSNGGSRFPVGGLVGALLSEVGCTTGALVSGTSPEHMRARLAAAAALLGAMRPRLDLGRALLRGRYLCAVARIEAVGIPIDRDSLNCLRANWPAARRRLAAVLRGGAPGFMQGADLDARPCAGRLIGGNEGSDASRLTQGRLLGEARASLATFDPHALTVGDDDRNRTPLRPFASRTGRNQPSAKASVLGVAAWARHLIKPRPGTGLALIDWQQQEFGIAAALSDDLAMKEAYSSGDPYLALAVAAGAVPPEATAASHAHVRERFKACALGVQYGMGEESLARKIGIDPQSARELLDHHKRTFPRFWSWSDDIEISAALHGELRSVFGWRLATEHGANRLSVRNFPMQANGAEMLRLACCLATERGITVCAPIHDALLIEAPLSELVDVVATTQRLMAEASAVVLDGFALGTAVRVVRAPDRWTDPRGQALWSVVECVLDAARQPDHQREATCSRTITRPISLYVSEGRSPHGSD